MTARINPKTEAKEKEDNRITTIKVNVKTKARLDSLKIHPKESYEEIMRKILGILNMCKFNPSAARTKLLEIDRQREINKPIL